MNFYWPESKKKELMIISICDQASNAVVKWSGQFRVDKFGFFTIKVKNSSMNILSDRDVIF